MKSTFLPDVVRPSVAVDVVILTLLPGEASTSSGRELHVLLVERGVDPFRGALALPGGFLHVGAGGVGGEHLDDAAARELVEETGLSRAQVLLEQVGAFGAPGRDPRGRVITVAYFALVRPELARYVRAGSDAAGAHWLPVTSLGVTPLAFDHKRIIEATLTQMRTEVDRGPLALHLAPKTFTVAELRAVHEALHGRKLDAGNFRRRFARLVESGVVVAASGKRITGRKHAALWQASGGRGSS